MKYAYFSYILEQYILLYFPVDMPFCTRDHVYYIYLLTIMDIGYQPAEIV